MHSWSGAAVAVMLGASANVEALSACDDSGSWKTFPSEEAYFEHRTQWMEESVRIAESLPVDYRKLVLPVLLQVINDDGGRAANFLSVLGQGPDDYLMAA